MDACITNWLEKRKVLAEVMAACECDWLVQNRHGNKRFRFWHWPWARARQTGWGGKQAGRPEVKICKTEVKIYKTVVSKKISWHDGKDWHDGKVGTAVQADSANFAE